MLVVLQRQKSIRLCFSLKKTKWLGKSQIKTFLEPDGYIYTKFLFFLGKNCFSLDRKVTFFFWRPRKGSAERTNTKTCSMWLLFQMLELWSKKIRDLSKKMPNLNVNKEGKQIKKFVFHLMFFINFWQRFSLGSDSVKTRIMGYLYKK